MLPKDRRSTLHPVALCPAADIQPGQRKLVEADGAEIVIVNAEGNLYAFRNSCPHQGAPMAYGPITGTMLPSEPKDYLYGCDNEIVRCPLHGWEFDMKTGKSLFAPDKVSIITYQVAEREGTIVLYLKQEPKQIRLKSFICHV